MNSVYTKITSVKTNQHIKFDDCSKLIEKHIKYGAFESGRILHAHLITSGLVRFAHFGYKLMEFYVQCKRLCSARKLFDVMPRSVGSSWVVYIGSFSRHGFYREAMNVFCEMQREGVRGNKFVFPSVLRACGHLSDWKTGRMVHAVVLKNGFESDAFIGSALIDMYSKCGFVGCAGRVFDGLQEKDLVILNAMVSGYVQNGKVTYAWNLVEGMMLMGVKPDVVTWNALIAGFSQVNDEVMVGKFFKFMSDDGIKPDAVSWTSVISGFVQNFRNKEAFHTFRQMLDAGLFPTSSTISSLISACANVADVRHGKEIHGYAVLMGFEGDTYVRSALIDMYAKCGFINGARTLFQNMPEKNTVTWNSMMFGYSNNGLCDQVFELFNQMLREDEHKLDHLTFTAVLTACSHAGMVHLGKSLFHLMQDKYRIVPRLEHYACMVDLLGRAGELHKAYDLVKAMPIEPDSFVWGALLGACRLHGRVDLAEIAAKQVTKLEPESPGSSLLMSSLYANSSRWQNAAKMKKMVKKRKLKRFCDSSWIEVV